MNKPLHNKNLERYVIRKVVIASSIKDALKKERGVPVTEIYVEKAEVAKPQMGYNSGATC